MGLALLHLLAFWAVVRAYVQWVACSVCMVLYYLQAESIHKNVHFCRQTAFTGSASVVTIPMRRKLKLIGYRNPYGPPQVLGPAPGRSACQPLTATDADITKFSFALAAAQDEVASLGNALTAEQETTA